MAGLAVQPQIGDGFPVGREHLTHYITVGDHRAQRQKSNILRLCIIKSTVGARACSLFWMHTSHTKLGSICHIGSLTLLVVFVRPHSAAVPQFRYILYPTKKKLSTQNPQIAASDDFFCIPFPDVISNTAPLLHQTSCPSKEKQTPKTGNQPKTSPRILQLANYNHTLFFSQMQPLRTK